MQLGSTVLPKIFCTWPHKVSIGNSCKLEVGVAFKFDGIYSEGISIRIDDNVFIGRGVEFNISHELTIGSDCLIASGCIFVDHDHSFQQRDTLIRKQLCVAVPIKIGKDVWIGANSIILKGVTIGDGAVIGAGSVVNRSVGSCEVWAGAPARKIKTRINRAG